MLVGPYVVDLVDCNQLFKAGQAGVYPDVSLAAEGRTARLSLCMSALRMAPCHLALGLGWCAVAEEQKNKAMATEWRGSIQEATLPCPNRFEAEEG